MAPQRYKSWQMTYPDTTKLTELEFSNLEKLWEMLPMKKRSDEVVAKLEAEYVHPPSISYGRRVPEQQKCTEELQTLIAELKPYRYLPVQTLEDAQAARFLMQEGFSGRLKVIYSEGKEGVVSEIEKHGIMHI